VTWLGKTGPIAVIKPFYNWLITVIPYRVQCFIWLFDQISKNHRPQGEKIAQTLWDLWCHQSVHSCQLSSGMWMIFIQDHFLGYFDVLSGRDAQSVWLCEFWDVWVQLHGETCPNLWWCHCNGMFLLFVVPSCSWLRGDDHSTLLPASTFSWHELKPCLMCPLIHWHIEIILTGCITALYGNCSASDRKALQRVVRKSQYITGAKLPAIYQVVSEEGSKNCQRLQPPYS
jgi:hypothetical protein